MGTYYLYVNETRKQYFYVDPTLQRIKWGCVGNNFGSRILSLLLLNDPRGDSGLPPHEMLGSWIGDRFRITGDEYERCDDKIEQTHENVGQRVIDMMSIVDPYSFVDCSGPDWLINYAGQTDTMPEPIRRRLLKFFRLLHNDQPCDEYARIVDSLRPKVITDDIAR